MDRIYYFMLTRDKNVGAQDCLPIFRKIAGEYEVYYLQMSSRAEREQLPMLQAHMAKGIQRLFVWYQEGPWWKEKRSIDPGRIQAYLAYEASFEKWLQEKHLTDYWQQLWNLPMYGEYREVHNLYLLLKLIPKKDWPQHLVILGEAPGIQEWIYSLAKHMKDITIYAGTIPRGFESMREELLREYGLVLKWKRDFWPQADAGSMVLDYSGRENVFVWGVPKGSVWIDMTSTEARRHAITDRDTGIRYFSLKCFWQEEISQTLDTSNKIHYNT